ncbi:hypothetical protein P0F65_03085 [Sphingomonas sp. I4]
MTATRALLIVVAGTLAAWPAVSTAQQAQGGLPRASAIDPAPGDASANGQPARPVAQQKRTRISPYVEVGQGINADLNTGDTVTYTSLAAGVNAQVQTRRAEGQISYRYEHRFGWGDRVGDGDIHSGLARASYRISPTLSLDGGALATRTRADIRGAAPACWSAMSAISRSSIRPISARR